MRAQEFITEAWSKKYKQSIDCSRPRGFSQRAHCASRQKQQVSEEQVDESLSAVEQLRRDLEQEQNVLKKLDPSRLYNYIDAIMQKIAKKYSISDDDLHDMWMEKYSEKPDTWITQTLTEDLRKWFKEKWVRFGPDGKIKGSCARGSKGEGKPKCLPQKKAHALGKKGRASAARRKRREDPNADRRGKAKNVATKSKK